MSHLKILMRILHLVHQYLPDHVGGTELYTHWLAQALNRQGHHNIIFHRRSAEETGLDSRTDETGVQIWAVSSGPMTPNRRFMATFGERTILQAFERVLAETQPDLVHIQHLMGLPAALIRLIQQQRIPFVITLWDFWWICANAQLLTNYSQEICDGPQAFINCARCALARAGRSRLWPMLPPVASLLAWRNHLLHQIMKDANRLIAPTNFVRDWYAGHGTPTANLTVVEPGLDQPAVQFQPSQNPDRELRFAYVGGLTRQKGVHVLIEAFRKVEVRAELWIAGDEAADPAYSASLRALASLQVRFLGKLTRPEVWATLAQVDVVVVPTLWYETFSFIISEAFAARAPVIASRLGPLADRVRDGVDGLLVPPGDSRAWQQALQQFLQDPTLLPRLRANIQPVWTMTDHVQAIEALYLELTS